MIARSDLLAVVPKRLAQMQSHLFQIFEPPIAIADFPVAMLWHSRTHNDQAHQWLRNQVLQSCVDLKLRATITS